jgi:NADPH:quinone reductase-like Zn-dependent oxidoreductase
VGSAGSAAKVDHLTREVGYDAAFDYYDGLAAELLAKAAPDGIDVFVDNVGGDKLAAAVGALREFGRIVRIGTISRYNTPDAPPPHLCASGRSQQVMSAASTSRPSAALGSGTAARASRSRAMSTRPAARASYSPPCPRRCSPTSDSSTSERTGPSAHSTASASSNRASERLVRQE